MKDGNFIDAEGNILAGQDEVKSLLHRCWRWTEIVLERYPPPPIFSGWIVADDLTEKAKLTNGSETNTTDCWKFATNWTACP